MTKLAAALVAALVTVGTPGPEGTFAKTGTAPMPFGASMGLVVALEPADRPTRAVVVVAPGAAGLDAAEIAADLLGDPSGVSSDGPFRDQGGSGGASKDALVLRSASSVSTIRIGVTGANGRVRATTLQLEDYIARVVAAEGQPKAADGAQQALAITARTFALANLNRHRREGYDLCDSTHCQVMRPATDTTQRAAAATAGRVLVYQGQPASVFYSALCGGTSELASEVWPGAINYSSDSHDDDACEDEPGWSSEIRVEQIERALRAMGHRGDRLRDLRVAARNDSGRVAVLRVDGFTPNEITGHDFRTAVGRVAGWQQMKSTAFELRRVAAGYRFTGRGFGHGVGLCVIGAGKRAARGRSADEILKFYFPNLRVEVRDVASVGRAATKPGASAVTAGRPEGAGAPAVSAPRRAEGSPAAKKEDVGVSTADLSAVALAKADASAKAVSPASAIDVLLALPASEESERARVADLVRAARNAIAGKAGIKPPPSIRVTVHPTVEAFGRATGQPWWVSGATDGDSIDLLPLTILRQQGQLERTIRHEVAHVVLEASLKGRPLWVREGAALYFADPAASPERPGRSSCPADDEFLRPVSAGAHRGAYARAEACVARAVASGKRWQEIK